MAYGPRRTFFAIVIFLGVYIFQYSVVRLLRDSSSSVLAVLSSLSGHHSNRPTSSLVDHVIFRNVAHVQNLRDLTHNATRRLFVTSPVSSFCNVTSAVYGRKQDQLYPFNKDADFPQTRHILCQPKLQISHSPGKRTVLAFVVSAFDNRARRDCIRQTWASRRHQKDYSQNSSVSLTVFFVIGVPLRNKSVSNASIRDEMRQHNDLLLVNVADTYETIVHKEHAAMAWILNNTRDDVVTNVFKTDDDTLLNTPGWLNLLQRYPMNGKVKRYIIGNHCSARVKVKFFKGHSMTEEYNITQQKTYPMYCQGEGFLISRAALLAIVQKMRHMKAFWIEDVYISGILAAMTNTSIYRINPKPPFEVMSLMRQRVISSTGLKPMIVHHMSDTFKQWQEFWTYYEHHYATPLRPENMHSIKLLVRRP